MACLLGIQNAIQAVWSGTSVSPKLFLTGSKWFLTQKIFGLDKNDIYNNILLLDPYSEKIHLSKKFGLVQKNWTCPKPFWTDIKGQEINLW